MHTQTHVCTHACKGEQNVVWTNRGSNPGLPACEAGALPLSYTPHVVLPRAVKVFPALQSLAFPTTPEQLKW